MTDARDVIARDALPGIVADGKLVPDLEMVDRVVAALAAAGLSITETPDEWEWGVRDEDWPGGPFVHDGYSEEGARAQREDGSTVVRRRPAGPWEVAP